MVGTLPISDGGADAALPEGGGQPALDGAADAGDSAVTIDADAGPVDPYGTRVTTGLYALYDFEENAGNLVRDGIAPAYDLTVADPAKVAWHPHYLEIVDYTSLSNTNPFAKLVTNGLASNEVTVETWVEITAVTGGGITFGRLVSIAQDPANVNIDLGLHGSNLWASFNSSLTTIEQGPVAVALSHIVLTRAADKTLRLYRDGALFDSATNVGDPASFASYRMVVGNRLDNARGIKDKLHLLAFYSAALTPAEISKNYAAGPDPR